MARSAKKTGKRKGSGRAPPRKRASAPTRRRPGTAPAPPAVIAPPARLSPAERLAGLRVAFQAQLERAWAGLAVTRLPSAAGVELRAARSLKVRPHWHLVTSGLAARGFELSFKVPAQKDEPGPPAWAVGVLASLVRHVGQPGAAIAEGQCVSLGAPLEATLGQEMQAVALGLDPELGAIEAPQARCPVLLAVGITLDEERLVREWSPTGLLEVLAKTDPLLLTDLDRGSLLLAPRARSVIEQRAEREGSSMGTMWARVSRAEQTRRGITWTLSADAIESLVSLLKGRLGHQRGFAVQSAAFSVEVQPGDAPPRLDDEVLALKLSQTAARSMRSTLRAKPGKYTWELLPGFVLEAVGES